MVDYYWVAKYNDGTILKQYEGTEEVHSFKDIDQKKLKYIFLIPIEPVQDAFAIDKEIELKLDVKNLEVDKVEVIIRAPYSGRIIDKKEAIRERDNLFSIKLKSTDIGTHIIRWGIFAKNEVIEKKDKFIVLHENPFILHFDPSYMRLILLRRHYVSMSGNEKWLTWLLGWQGTIGGRNIKSILYIQPNGKIDISENFDLSL